MCYVIRIKLSWSYIRMALPGKARLHLLLVLLMTLFLFLLLLSIHHDNPINGKPRPMHVLVLSSWRSGSTFVGQLLGQHPAVFYLMEPAWHVWSTFPNHSARNLQMAIRDLMRAIFLCDMSVYDAYTKQQLQANQAATLFLWYTSPALCSPPACSLFSRDQVILPSDCRRICPTRPLQVVEEACRSYSHVVLKEVRFLHLRGLIPLLRDPALNLHIIHLVRDPRAVFRSRENTAQDLERDGRIVLGSQWQSLSREERADAIMRIVCQGHLDIYHAVRALPPALRQRYLLLRYEDLVRSPLELTAQMYEFARLEFLPWLQIWVHNITRGSGLGKQAFVVDARNALKVSQAWRQALPYEKVLRIQDVCHQAMSLLGYRLATSEQEQKNLSVDLLSPWIPAKPEH